MRRGKDKQLELGKKKKSMEERKEIAGVSRKQRDMDRSENRYGDRGKK